MEAGQDAQEGVHYEEESPAENPLIEGSTEPEQQTAEEQVAEPRQEEPKQDNATRNNQEEDHGSFIHGLAVGLGIGCIATFVIVWVSIFFTPQLPRMITYENLLAIFVYPLLYLLAVGLIALTAGVVREYYSRR